MCGQGLISFDEFSLWYNSLNGFMKRRLAKENRHEYAKLRSRERFVEAHSAHRPLGDIVSSGGRLALDANGRDYKVEVNFSKSCLSDKNKNTIVHAQTVVDDKVDNFFDDTYAQQIGRLLSPIVRVCLSGGHDELDDVYTVQFPHSLDDTSSELNKEDVIVAFGEFEDRAWHEVRPDAYELLPAEKGGCGAVRVKLVEAGIVALFARRGKPVSQRLQCFAFLPGRIIPLEPAILRVYICTVCPDQVEEVTHREAHERGLVVLAGTSETFVATCPTTDVTPGSTAVSISVDQGDGPEKHGLLWNSEISQMNFRFAPKKFRQMLEKLRAEAGSEAKLDAGHIHDEKLDHVGTRQARRPTTYDPDSHIELPVVHNGKMDVEVEVMDLMNRRDAAKTRDVTNHHSSLKNEKRSFQAEVNIHEFPPPGAPTDIKMVIRSNTYIGFEWEVRALPRPSCTPL